MFGKYTLPIILAIESILCVFIISYVSYTEIDWKAYMQEVAGFEMGERNYKELAGDTGPLVYPAGFLYIFYLLKKITNEGKDILRVQAIFGALYVFILFLTIRIYQVGAKMPAWTWFLLILSKRIHSIYVLRCFNDCFAVLFGFLAVLHFTKYKYKIGCVFYSLAVSIKMNMLLYAPGILLILLLGTSGIQETVVCLAICASIQLLLGAPFLLSFPVEYLSRAYDLTRKFDYQWTVNFKFLPEVYFLSPVLSIALLGSTIVAYGLFGRKWILESWKNVASRQKKALKLLGANDASYLIGMGRLSPHYLIVTIFVSNFVGIGDDLSLPVRFDRISMLTFL